MSVIDSKNGASIRICVRDATRMGSQLLSDVLRRDRRFEVVGVPVDPDSFASAHIEVAVLFCDPMQAPDQLELIRKLRSLKAAVRAIALMDDPAPEAVLQAFRAGARGIFCRSDSYKKLPKCVIRVYNGHIWASQSQLSILVEAIGQPFPMSLVDARGMTMLSPREQHVVHWVAEGLTNREIADRMQLSEHTVKNYMFRIFDKLGVSSRSELVLYALSHIARQISNASDAQVGENGSQATCDMRFCPLLQFQLGWERQRRGTALEDCEGAYCCFALAEAAGVVVLEKSAALLRDLEKLIPPNRLSELKAKIDEQLQEIRRALTIGAQRGDSTNNRVA